MQPVQTAVHAAANPVLKVKGRLPHFDQTHCTTRLPLTFLKHLTIADAQKWPAALYTLPNLEFLDMSHARALESIDMNGVTLSADSHLRELYTSDTACTSVMLSACSSLVSAGIKHRGREAPLIDLPTSLQKLYLLNVLSCDSHQVLVTPAT